MTDKKRLVLIDGHALLYRAYHALPKSMITSQGEPTNAIYGFLSTFFKVLEEEQPEHVVVCFDKGRTFRHDLYEEYKAHRAKMPDDLRPQVERLDEVLQAMGVPTYAEEGYEADDLIGTLAQQASEAGLDTLIVTGDLDTLQLVDDQVHVLTPGRRYSETTVYDPERVRERFGFDPEKLVVYKGLKGDPSDNIPGVSGVGDKTATRLIQKYGTLDEIYAHLDEVGKRYRSPLEEQREQAYFSQELATIRTDVPVELDLPASRLGGHDPQALSDLFRQLEFRTLLKRLPPAIVGEGPVASRQLSLFGEEGEEEQVAVSELGEIVRTEAGLEAMIAALGQGPLAFDTETTSLDALRTEMVGISLAHSDGRSWYIPLAHRGEDGQRAPDQLDWELVRARLAPLLADPDRAKYAHHAKFDMLVLGQHGVTVRGVTFDTMIAAHLLSERSARLKDLAFAHLGVQMQEIDELLGSGRNQRTMDVVPIDQVGPYACADALVTSRLRERFAPRLEEEGLASLFAEVEMPLVPVLVDMERAGIRLDVDYLQRMSDDLAAELQLLEEEIHHLAGHPFNVRSTQQFSEVLFEELGMPLTATRRLKTGSYSTASDVLERLRGRHPIVEAVLHYRELAKLCSTYVDALPQLVNPETGRIHTSLNQAATSTGRLSSSEPNLQNIPIRTELGRRVRYAFVAQPGWHLLAADYSQVELRVLAHLSQDPGLLQAFGRGEDIHASTAAALFGIETEHVTAEQRRVAKTVNFGLMYGMSAYGLAQRLEIERGEAERFIRTYFERYAGVQEYLEETLRQGRKRGYVSTVLGRRRYIRGLTSRNRNVQAAAEREAINAPIQGSAADIIKIAMVRLHRELAARGLESRMLLQVHDELVLEVPESERGEVEPLVVDVMEGAYQLDVPLRVEAHAGPTWGDLK